MIQSVISAILGLVVGGVIFFPLGIRYRKNVSEKEISSAEEEGKRIINEAIKSAETKKKEALLEAKEEILKLSLIHIWPPDISTGRCLMRFASPTRARASRAMSRRSSAFTPW